MTALDGWLVGFLVGCIYYIGKIILVLWLER